MGLGLPRARGVCVGMYACSVLWKSQSIPVQSQQAGGTLDGCWGEGRGAGEKEEGPVPECFRCLHSALCTRRAPGSADGRPARKWRAARQVGSGSGSGSSRLRWLHCGCGARRRERPDGGGGCNQRPASPGRSRIVGRNQARMWMLSREWRRCEVCSSPVPYRVPHAPAGPVLGSPNTLFLLCRALPVPNRDGSSTGCHQRNQELRACTPR